MNGEFLCFTLLSNFVKKKYFQNSQEKSQLRKNLFDTLNDVSILHFWLIRYVPGCQGVSSSLPYFERFLPTIFWLVSYLSLKDSICETKKNNFYFNLRTFFVLEKIRFSGFSNFRYSSYDLIKCVSMKKIHFTE